jgi:ATP phosphoribosyltransferase
MATETLSICLPKGNAMQPLAGYLDGLQFPLLEYHSKNRTYRPEVRGLPVRAKIMAEKDVAIQVAVGNYDIGFCGADWVQEYTIKYRAKKLHVLKNLGMDRKNIYACTGLNGGLNSVEDLHKKSDFITIVSEYPNLAESFAIQRKLRKFKIFSAWGSVEAYPPEHADVVLLSVYEDSELTRMGLHNITLEVESQLCLIVNHKSFIEKDLASVLNYFSNREC